MRANTSVGIKQLIDQSKISALQLYAFCGCALVALLDGYNTQSIGVAAPAIAHRLGLTRAALGPVFSAALLGAMVGAIAFGPLADRIGRKRMLLVAIVVFAIFTGATAWAPSFPMLLAVRFCAGLGLGGATPCFIALTAEYAPTRVRAGIVTAMWAAFPLGGVLGGLINPSLAAAFGANSLFFMGAWSSLLIAIILALTLPESLRYLIATGASARRIETITRRLSPAIDARTLTIDLAEREQGIIETLRCLPLLSSVLLWVLFFTSFLILVFTPLWAPSLLARTGGLTLRQAALVVALNNLGSAFGTAGFGRLLDRFAPARVLVPLFLGSALFTAGIGIFGQQFYLAAICSLLGGMLTGGASAGAIAVAATAYPTRARSTGIGLGMAAARLGQVVGPLVAGALLVHRASTAEIFAAVGGFSLIAAVCARAISAERSGGVTVVGSAPASLRLSEGSRAPE
jgi:AAHS family 4-hydroxybenzoate transporter-like MFS transporter